ncbi:MAG: hypothetical protein QME64_07540, partial [bacterium]|nr:hypothetical protein [bacterium]
MQSKYFQVSLVVLLFSLLVVQFCFAETAPNWYPVYRFYKSWGSVTQDHWYTMSSSEGVNAGYTCQTIAFYFSS